MNKVKYIVVDTGSESNRSMMSDIGRLENGVQLSGVYNINNKILKFLLRLHFSYSINCKIILPGKSIWKSFMVINNMIKDENTEYYIIIVNNAIHKLCISDLNELAKRNNVHLVSLIIDVFNKLPANVRLMIKKTNFEQYYSFQRSDCQKYGFKFTNQIYSKDKIPNVKEKLKYDVYFVGLEKDRIDEIYKIYCFLESNCIKCKFKVIINKNMKKRYQKKYPGIEFLNKRVGYNTILNDIAHTKCILEICQEGQDGLTMRFYEAIFYNKKLITNNMSARDSEFYNDKYMNIIQNVQDIDVDMIKRNDEIKYDYHDEMSPIHFLESITNRKYE